MNMKKTTILQQVNMEEFRQRKIECAYKRWAQAQPETFMREKYWYDYCDARDDLTPGETEKRTKLLGLADELKMIEMKRRAMEH